MLQLIIHLVLFLPFYCSSSPPGRLRRQLEFNASVPYIFSARLYPFGSDRGDLLIQRDVEPYALENPVIFLGEQYDSLYIRRDGSVSFRDGIPSSPRLPAADPTIAAFWSANKASKVMYRETDDVDIINLAHNEVNIQYRYGARFRVKSVLIVTWEVEEPKGLFQLALIIGDNLTFAHFIYSKLFPGAPAFAGFSGNNYSFSLPDAGTPEAFLLGERSDIGIPGEWLFQVNNPQVFLCGAGYRGLECVESCAASQWSNDCHRSCHCDGGDPCDQETGRCPSGTCSPGWTGPACEDDLDECAASDDACPAEQPDCVNTAGAFLCLCFEYEEDKKTCKGAPPPKEVFEVSNVSMRPSFGRQTTPTPRRTPPPRRFPSSSTSSRPTTTSPVLRAAVLQEVAPSLPIPLPPSACDFCHKNADCTGDECKCKFGYEGDGLSCIDIDECRNEGICGENSICQNTHGSYDCECNQGFSMVQGSCQDMDECFNSPCGHSDGVQCVNIPGSYRCECKEGFDPLNDCKDVDECRAPNACGPHARCTNIVGGFECECLSGFERLSEGANCTDINECMIEPCHPAARCTNEPGAFDCKCIDGFVGDGLECHETTMYPIANDSIVLTRAPESSTTIALAQPVKFFGHSYSTVFLSSNGVISFDSMVHGLLENPSKLSRPLVLALHSQMDYAREGLIAYTFVSDSDETAYSVLTRSSVTAETQFGLSNFRPKNLHVFTFDKIRQAGSANVNSFQVVIAADENTTLLTMIYDKVEAKGALAGIYSSSSSIEFPIDSLTTQSNVGRPGRWMMRVDSQLEPCPPGRIRAPLCDQDCSAGRWGFGCQGTCHCAGNLPCDPLTGKCTNEKCAAGWEGELCNQDVDECFTGIVICGEHSECINSLGGYDCRCIKGYFKNGTSCQQVDPCAQKLGRACHSQAVCQSHGISPSCVCKEGFRGDGFSCEARTSLPVIDIRKEILLPSLEGLPPVEDIEIVKEVGENPFVMQTWLPAQTAPPTRRPLIVTAPKAEEITKPPRNITVVTEAPENLSNLYLWFGLPGVLCIIWIILVVVILAMWKKRRTNNVDDFGKVWRQPTRTTTTTRSAGTTRIPITGPPANYSWRY